MLTVVTGAAGFIGSRLIEALNRSGVRSILAVDNLENPDKTPNLARVDVADYMDKREFLERVGSGALDDAVEAVLHQGACSDTMHPDGRYVMENNYAFSCVVLDWCQRLEAPLIYASSAAVYGAGRSFAEARENEEPLNVYGYSKFLFDQRVRAMLPERTAPVVGLRYFNVYGPNEAHKGRMASVAFHAFHQLRGDGRVRLFAGSDGCADGEHLRDFVHVDDCVAVNLHFLGAGDASGIFNCGTGRAQSFNVLAATVVNTVRGTSATAAELAQQRLIEYVPMPAQLVGRYQSYTQADLTRLRAAGYGGRFRPVQEGAAQYVRELMRA